jgi:hypothetical protein
MKSFKIFYEEFTPVGDTQYGSNPGGIHIDSDTGDKHYIKHYENHEQAKVEALTGQIYKHMGIHTADPKLHNQGSISSKWNDNLHQMKRHEFESLSPKQANQVGKMYHAAVLTKNWDIVGLEHDNILHNSKTGNLHAIDHGGAFHFRAQGGHKDYGPDIAEKDSLRGFGGASAHVFNHTFAQHPKAEEHGLNAVKKIDDNHIRHLFSKSGLDNHQQMAHTFIERKNALINSYK